MRNLFERMSQDMMHVERREELSKYFFNEYDTRL